eukprot:766752-Hanusia_phi.AAC.3
MFPSSCEQIEPGPPSTSSPELDSAAMQARAEGAGTQESRRGDKGVIQQAQRKGGGRRKWKVWRLEGRKGRVDNYLVIHNVLRPAAIPAIALRASRQAMAMGPASPRRPALPRVGHGGGQGRQRGRRKEEGKEEKGSKRSMRD